MSSENEPTVFPGLIERGITKREYIATQIAAGLAAHNGTFGETGSPSLLAGRAVHVADMLLAELAKPCTAVG